MLLTLGSDADDLSVRKILTEEQERALFDRHESGIACAGSYSSSKSYDPSSNDDSYFTDNKVNVSDQDDNSEVTITTTDTDIKSDTSGPATTTCVGSYQPYEYEREDDEEDEARKKRDEDDETSKRYDDDRRNEEEEARARVLRQAREKQEKYETDLLVTHGYIFAPSEKTKQDLKKAQQAIKDENKNATILTNISGMFFTSAAIKTEQAVQLKILEEQKSWYAQSLKDIEEKIKNKKAQEESEEIIPTSPNLTGPSLFAVPVLVWVIGVPVGTVLGPLVGPAVGVIYVAVTATKIIKNYKKNNGGGGGGGDDDKDKKKPDDPKDPKDPKKKYTYQHGRTDESKKHHKNSRDGVGKPAKDAQAALDNSFEVKDSTQRIAVEKDTFVVLKETAPGLYHAYVSEWANLSQKLKNALVKAKVVNISGKFL